MQAFLPLSFKRNNFIYKFIYFWQWVFIAAWAFASCREQGLLFSCGVRASHCSGFSYCGAQALEHRLSNCGAQSQLL